MTTLDKFYSIKRTIKHHQIVGDFTLSRSEERYLTDIEKTLKAFEILKEYLTIDEEERALRFDGNLSGIIFAELTSFGGNPHYELLKEVLEK